MKNGFRSPEIQKRTKRKLKKEELLKEKKYKNIEFSELDEIVNHQVRLEDSHPRQEKPKYFGEIIEMDGSIHNWFGKDKTCLHLAIDVSTGTIVGGYFQSQETLKGYYTILYQILIKYGIPLKFKTDNRTVFNYNRLDLNKRTSDKDVLTQFGYACSILGTDLETTSVSQAKGTIERANGTFQRRLVNELNLLGITSMNEANDYLIKKFIPSFNRKFSRNYKLFESVFVDAPTPKNLNYILSILTERKIDNGNSIKFKNSYY
ncbi:MAG: ISNCY family transposase, partial [Erysipelotrichaceae bacterium]